MQRIPRDFTADLIVPPSGAVHPVVAIDAWLRVKEAQQLEDGTSGRITPERLARLQNLTGWPRRGTSHEQLVAELDQAVDHARPRIAAAARRARLSLQGVTS